MPSPPRPPFRGRRGGLFPQPSPYPLPLVATVGVTGTTATSTNVVGSVNGQGYSGTWWIVYGTVPQYGSQTAPMTFSAETFPQTFTAELTGLTTGDTYFAAIVGSTVGGTVTALPVTFVPATPSPVPNANNPIVNVGTPAVAIPHFYFPYTIEGSAAAVVEQNSLAEIQSCVAVVASCQIGECPELPTFGIPDITFSPAPPSPAAIVAAIQLWEPRADEQTIVTQLDLTGANWQIQLQTSAVGTGGNS